MNSLRESLSSIPGNLSTFMTENPISYFLNNTNNSVESSQSQSAEEDSEKTHAIPTSLIKEQWQLILGQDASITDLQSAIEKCKLLVLNSNECTDERKWLVRHLVELRFHLKELQDAIDDPQSIAATAIKVILGHHFSLRIGRSLPTSRQYCDHCTGIIWNVVQSSYACSDCNCIVHSKCVENILRICAHITVSERKHPIAEICPINATGLSAQGYKCAECETPLMFQHVNTVRCFGPSSRPENSWVEPRLCDYSGLFYCSTCHWNDKSIIPARVIHNWDFTARRVCRASLQEINLFLNKSVINIEELNPKLFQFLQKLSALKKKRENILIMKKYLTECRLAIETKLLDTQIEHRRHLIQSSGHYSLTDLLQVESGMLNEFLTKIYNSFETHIRNCYICHGKGYICEICNNKEVMFPFEDGCVYCDKCNSIYHRSCWTLKNSICKKCIRLEERKLKLGGLDEGEGSL